MLFILWHLVIEVRSVKLVIGRKISKRKLTIQRSLSPSEQKYERKAFKQRRKQIQYYNKDK